LDYWLPTNLNILLASTTFQIVHDAICLMKDGIDYP
jgi:hypothetical protein